MPQEVKALQTDIVNQTQQKSCKCISYYLNIIFNSFVLTLLQTHLVIAILAIHFIKKRPSYKNC